MRAGAIADAVRRLPVATRILAVGAFSLVALTLAVLLVVRQRVQQTIQEELQAEVLHAGAFHRYLVDQKGPAEVVGGKLTFGTWTANGDFSVVDLVKQTTGAEATLFQLINGKLIRVATTIEKLDGTGRGVGTELVGPAATAFDRGADYSGVGPILGRDFITHYDLIRDPSGRPIGYVLTAKPLAVLAETTGRIERSVYSTALYALFVCLVLLFVVIQPVGKAITLVAAAAQNLARGDINQRVTVRGTDEVGRMADAFRAMIGYQTRMAAAADAIARGELDVEVQLQSDRDVLGLAFQRMTTSLHRMAGAADAIARGDLTVQVEPQSEKDVLGVAFEQMVANLAQHEAELAASHARLAESEARNRLVVDTALDAIVTMNSAGVVTGWNPYAETIFGWTRNDAVGRLLADTIVPDRYREAHTRGLARFLVTGEGPVLNQAIEITALHRDGREFPIDLKVVAVGSSGAYTFNAFVRDITARKQAEQRLAAQHAVTRVLAEAPTLAVATPAILDAVCEGLGWEWAALWRVDESEALLRCVETSGAQAGVAEFERMSRETSFAPGIGLPGRVWASGEASWIADLVADPNFPRQPVARQAGLHSAFGFPVRGSASILGVMEFFSHEIRQPDGALLAMMDAIGSQVGQFIERKRAEQALHDEQARSEELLLNILPKSIADRLKRDRAAIADGFADATVLFADIVDFTRLSSEIPPREVVALLNEVFSAFDELAERHSLEKIKTIGDAYMLVGGLPEPRPDHAEAVADMALDIQRELAGRLAADGRPIAVRIGINSGPVVAGVIGTKKFIYDLWGDTVNTASRMESQGLPSGIQVTEATYERLRHHYHLERRGVVEVKGKGAMPTYLLLGRKDAPAPDAGL